MVSKTKVLLFAMGLALFLPGCDSDPSRPSNSPSTPQASPNKSRPEAVAKPSDDSEPPEASHSTPMAPTPAATTEPATAKAPSGSAAPLMPPTAGKRTPLNKQGTLFLEVLPNDERRVVILSEVCLRKGPLELLLCRKQTKEHEAILHADVNAKDVHAALEVCRAKPGSPVKYVEDGKGNYQMVPPHGTTIRVWLEIEREAGKWETLNARQWIRNVRTGKELDRDWVFAGSALWTDPDDPEKKVHYLANNGNLISVANFTDSMMDLPFASSKANAELIFECWTDRIPPLGTKVYVVLEPVLDTPK